MRYNSAFEIIGPIMVGPSSSHTAGPVRIGNLARQLLVDEPRKVIFQLMGSFAETHQGHGTDLALLAGILGFATDDPDVTTADQKALETNLEYTFKKANFGFFHPNTVALHVEGLHRQVDLIASSLGGGKIEVQELDGLPVRFTGENPTLILNHVDERGFLAKVSSLLENQGYNIARLTLERRKKGGEAVTVCEFDKELQPDSLKKLLTAIPQLHDIRIVQTS
jgi:L-serine dehydratase